MNANPSASALPAASENVSCRKAPAGMPTLQPSRPAAAPRSVLESGGRTGTDGTAPRPGV
jgi:hypothetical protein